MPCLLVPWCGAMELNGVKMLIGTKVMQSSAMMCLGTAMESSIEKSGAERWIGVVSPIVTEQ